MSVELYLVGGAVRDRLLGLASKDYDFTAVASGGWNELRDWLVDNGFHIFVENPNYLTIRAHFPKGWTFDCEDMSKLTGDFVLARKEGEYSDGRRPDAVEPGTLKDDLSRRDFTINALAIGSEGNVIDLFGGMRDIRWRRLRCVGSPEERFTEDALRAVRALRFSLTKGFEYDDDICAALDSAWLPPLVERIAFERRMDEVDKMLKFDTPATVSILAHLTEALRNAILSGYRLTTTSKKVK